MDPFTQKLLERTKEWRRVLDEKSKQTPQPLPRKRRSPLGEGNATLKPTALSNASSRKVVDDDSPGKRQCLTFSTKSNKDVNLESKENEESVFVSPNVKDVLKDPPKRRSEDVRECDLVDEITVPKHRSGRLAALAARINTWEDESAAVVKNSNSKNDPSSENSGKKEPVNTTCSPPRSVSTDSSIVSSFSPSSSTDSVSPSLLKQFRSPTKSPSFKTPNSLKRTKSKSPQKQVSKCKADRSSSTDSSSSGSSTLFSPRRSSSSSSFKNGRLASKFAIDNKHQNSSQKTRPQTGKQMVWDEAIVSALQAQGFVQSPSRSKLQYEYEKKLQQEYSEKHSQKVEQGQASADVNSSYNNTNVTEPLKKSVKELAQNFDDAASQKPRKDPAEMSLAARVAIFEKEAAASEASKKLSALTKPKESQISQRTKPSTESSIVKSPPLKKVLSPCKETTSPTISPSKLGQHTFELHRQLFEKSQTWKENEFSAKIREERQRDMDVVMNRWSHKNKAAATLAVSAVTAAKSGQMEAQKPTETANTPASRPNISKLPSKVKQNSIPMPPPLPGRPETVLAVTSKVVDDDSEDEEVVLSEDSCTSGDECEEFIEEPEEESLDCSSASDQYQTAEDLDDDHVQDAIDVIDKAFSNSRDRYDDFSSSDGSDHQQQSEKIVESVMETDLDSSILKEAFTKVGSPTKQIISEFAVPKPPVKELFSGISESEEDDAPLMHTVSFYRRQKQALRINNTKAIVRREDIPSVHDDKAPDSNEKLREDKRLAYIQQKLEHLQEEVNAQQIVISQASQALNLCRTNPEFHGSPEQMEGERLLLIASQKRLACLNEMQRLKTEGALGKSSSVSFSPKGYLTIGEMKLSLKREFLEQTANGTSGDFVHFFICLIKHQSQVVATQMMSTHENISAGCFYFPNLINIRELEQDFNVIIEVYGLQTKRDNIEREKRSLVNRKEKSRMTLTPRKSKSKRDVRIQSPGGPSAVCITSFQLIGYSALNLKSLQRKSWTLEKVPFVSPLEGNLFMKVRCHNEFSVEQKGFLTMFEDVGGFGSWHRRYFVLSSHFLSYWKYPDDYTRKEPIGRIELFHCVTPNVGLVPRDICARPNTFMLMTVRSPTKDDKDTLVSQSYNSYTTTKVLLSADTKEERIVWCQNLNKALENLRAWDPESLRPMPCDQ